MRAGSYLSLARNYSFVIILLMFIGIEETQTYTRDVRLVGEARKFFADVVVATVDWREQTGKEKGTYPLKVEGLDSAYYEILRTVSGGEMYDKLSERKIQYDRFQEVRIYCKEPQSWTSGTYWIRVPAQTVDISIIQRKPSQALQALRELQRRVVGKAADIPADATPQREAGIIRKAIESNAFERRTAVPGIGLEFRNGIAPWFIALIVAGLVVQIRNQIRRTLLDPDLAIEEPWLVLDGRRGLEKLVAVTWALAILIAPWIATGCLIAVFTAESRIEGWALGALTEMISHLCLVSILLVGGWSSLTTFGELLRLRRLRLDKLATLAPRITSSP